MECLFCEFIGGRENHTKKSKFAENKPYYPLVPIFRNKDVFSFLSFPDNQGATDLLVIPKKHYEFIEDMPEKEVDKLFSTVVKMTGIVRKNYGDCKIILNDGQYADQYIKHVHFHIVPKTKKKTFLWHDLSHKKFEQISAELSNLFKDIH